MKRSRPREGNRGIAGILIASCLLVSSLTAGGWGSKPIAAAAENPASESFQDSTGMLDVNYAAYLSKHDIVYQSPISDPKGALMVGNGKVGGMVWDTLNGLTMQVSGVDASEEGFASQGLVNLYTSPGLNTGYSSYKQRLSLYDGTLTTEYDSNRKVTILGAPNSEVLGIHVEDSRTGLSNVSLDLSLWDVSSFGGGDVPDINTWRTVSTFVDPTVVGFSRGQTDANNFGYTLAATVEGASFTTQAVNGSKVRLNITPTSSYTIWISSASRLNAPNHNSVTEAKNQLATVKSAGYNATLTNYKNWWHNFWSKSFVQYSNASGDADYLENFYYLSTYMIAAGAFGNYPSHFINGVFSAVNDNDSGKWSNAYWYWNQRDIYHSFLASNHADMVNIFNNLYSRNFYALKSYTMTRYGIDGIWVPETMGWNASAAGTINSDYTQDTLSTAAEAALNMYAQYKYTNDAAYLSNTAYPFMKEAVKFYAKKLSFDSAAGKYYMASSNVHEQHWDVKNAITDLAAVRALFPVTIQTSANLGVDATLRAEWQNVLNNLVAYPVDPNDPNKYFPHEPPLSQNRNNENVVLELAWPYSVSGIGYPDYQKLVNNYNSRPFPYSSNNVWDPAPIQAARLGLGDEAYLGMKMMLQRYQQYPNGRTTNTNGEFEYMGVHLSAINESLLQSYNDKIRVFPATPTDAGFTGKFTLLASGGFLVSSEKTAGEIKYVGLKSQYGKQATVVNPWGTEQVRVRRVSDNAILATTANSEFSFNTAAGTSYVVERTAKPLSNYTHTTLSGTANEGVKSLSGTNSKLGLDANGGRVTVTSFYEDSNYGGTAKTLAAGSYTTAQLAAAGIPNNWVSSVKVPLGFTVTVYDNDNFTGTSWPFTNDTDFPSGTNPNANDKMSSVVITGPGGSGGTGGASTKYEAESGARTGTTNAANDASASGGQMVEHFSTIGDSVSIVNVQGGVKLIIGYCTSNNPGRLSLYINGADSGNITFPSTNSWNTTYSTVSVEQNIPAGATIKLQLDTGDSGANIDYVTVEAAQSQKIEAESGTLASVNATPDSAASGGYEVTGFSTPGSSSVAFTSPQAGSQLVIGYTTANTNSKMSLYVNNQFIKSVNFPSTGVWSGTYQTVQTAVSIPANAVVKLQLNSGDLGSNIDYFIVQP
ncbi:glycosyl hydrolase family 95 catalytic domain-containing protein [Paenibacillus glycanilyticus]|uniref:glycosyl hydrolase family 95 catalytic domain-containing protein n=1 Tax=Paenibacillus glycanilyticus TaxID=126569 RepID=UPI001910341C|nr:carbohydrate-binding domain-containing protein [Paenibacillus glycanilyticus]